jgi:hypothetical protein
MRWIEFAEALVRLAADVYACAFVSEKRQNFTGGQR